MADNRPLLWSPLRSIAERLRDRRQSGCVEAMGRPTAVRVGRRGGVMTSPFAPKAVVTECPTCHGKGRVTAESTGRYPEHPTEDCPDCVGGYVPIDPTTRCKWAEWDEGYTRPICDAGCPHCDEGRVPIRALAALLPGDTVLWQEGTSRVTEISESGRVHVHDQHPDDDPTTADLTLVVPADGLHTDLRDAFGLCWKPT